jgi:predicted metal-dependent hydrolase
VRITAAGTVELVVPRGVAEREAWAFLQTRYDWVRHHLARRRQRQLPPEAFPPREIRLALLGENWRVFLAGGSGRLQLRELAGMLLEIRGTGTHHAVRACLLRWLKARARQALEPRLLQVADQFGLAFARCQVRNQRSRWGSCSSQGVISLNAALLFQPADVVRYLCCHELAHTRHMNHSRRFWDSVAIWEPRYRELDAALTQGWRNVPAWVREIE